MILLIAALLRAGGRGRVGLDPLSNLGPDGTLVVIVVVASHEQDFEIWCPSQAGYLMTALGGGWTRGHRLRVYRLGGGSTTADLLRLEAIVANVGLGALEGGRGNSGGDRVTSSNELNVKGVYRP